MIDVILSFFRLVNEVFLKGKRNIHLVEDEKFIDFAYREFNEAGNQGHLFLIVGPNQKLKFIKSSEILIIHPRLFWHLIPYTKRQVKSIFFHSLPGKFYKNLILRIPQEIPIFWMSWGFDLIEVFGDGNNYVKPKTKIIASIKTQSHLIEKSGTSYYQAFKTLPESSLMVSRIDYLSTVMEEERKIIDLSFYQKAPKWIPWNYFNMEEDVIKGFEDKEVRGKIFYLGIAVIFGITIWMHLRTSNSFN
ncbi:hypothetical protein V8V91_05110 [Algoriphagus halophilus]|uniref:hypothetical protein n=1 Tax=Algoriphagus halophilus TaxID=226505 RepID=UPI00358E868B